MFQPFFYLGGNYCTCCCLRIQGTANHHEMMTLWCCFCFLWQVLHHMEDIKVREMQNFDYKKKIAESETKLKQQQNLYEAVRSDRNLYSKNLIEAQVLKCLSIHVYFTLSWFSQQHQNGKMIENIVHINYTHFHPFRGKRYIRNPQWCKSFCKLMLLRMHPQDILVTAIHKRWKDVSRHIRGLWVGRLPKSRYPPEIM